VSEVRSQAVRDTLGAKAIPKAASRNLHFREDGLYNLRTLFNQRATGSIPVRPTKTINNLNPFILHPSEAGARLVLGLKTKKIRNFCVASQLEDSKHIEEILSLAS
jgi:hypothetical protein